MCLLKTKQMTGRPPGPTGSDGHRLSDSVDSLPIASRRRRSCRAGAPDRRRVLSDGCGDGAFTLVEILVVIVILAIAAATVIPMMSSAGSIQIRSAAQMIAADLEYAKSMAISRGQNYSVVFNAGADSYAIQDQGGTVIAHPVKKGFTYVVDFANDARLNRVDIAAANFDGTSTVKFDYLGSPYDGDGNPLNSGSVTLQADTVTMTISVEAVTGYVSVD